MKPEKSIAADEAVQVDLTVPSETRYLALIGKVGEEVARNLAELSDDPDQFPDRFNLVLTEAMANVIEHTPHSEGSIRITIEIAANQLQVKVYDDGPGFDFETALKPDLDHPKEGGLGLFLIHTFMDSVQYQRMEDGNLLVMTKKLS